MRSATPSSATSPPWWHDDVRSLGVYVDYVDYDEIAHAGMFRPESLAALDGLDRVLGQLEQIAERAARRRIVVLSDHGQSQGRPFADRYGTDLSTLCAGLAAEEVGSYETSIEGWAAPRLSSRTWGTRGSRGTWRLCRAPDAPTAGSGHPQPTHEEDVVVLGSGTRVLWRARLTG